MAQPLSPGTAAKLGRVRSMIAALPALERQQWSDAVDQAVSPFTVAGAHVDYLPPPMPEPGKTAPIEWDLALANWLDRVYGAVTDRVAEVAVKTKELAKATAREVAHEATGGVGKVVGIAAAGAGLALLLVFKLKSR